MVLHQCLSALVPLPRSRNYIGQVVLSFDDGTLLFGVQTIEWAKYQLYLGSAENFQATAVEASARASSFLL